MSQHQASHDLFTPARDVPPGAAPEAPASVPVHEMRLPGNGATLDALGDRLRAARKAQGLEVAECSKRLHLPVKVLERLEANDFGSPEHFVFLRGPLTSYARFLGLSPDACTQALRTVAPSQPPALTSVAKVSHARWLLQRYGTAMTYIVLTAFIAVPLIVLGLRGGLERPPARVVSLDQAPVVRAGASRKPVPTPDATPDATPFRASMAPFSAMGLGESGDAAVTPAAAVSAPAPAPIAGPHTLTLTATGDCWFEITNADGGSVASGLLHAGETRTWQASAELHVTLGNADAVRVSRDGQVFGLDAYKRANVARFDVFGSTTGGATD